MATLKSSCAFLGISFGIGGSSSIRKAFRFYVEVFSSPGQSPGRAIVLPPAWVLSSALAASLALAKC